MIDELTTIDDLKKDLEEVLKNIEKHVLFIQRDINSQNILKLMNTLVNAHSPYIFIVSGIKSAAVVIRECSEKLEILLKENYKLEKFSTEERETLFFKRNLKQRS